MKSVFISSTFKDMQAERDLLHEQIFPRLRKIIGEYGEDIQELDLRWGVDTVKMSEEESGHHVLRVCIDAIDRCKPFIIVLLGERYGWIPDAGLVESLQDARVDAWYEEKMSITNLEIKYGALSEEETLRKCIFCFRNSSLLEEIDEEHRSLYAAESPMHQKKLNLLKEQIRNKKNVIILDYDAKWDITHSEVSGLEQFGEEIYHLLEQLIRTEFAGQGTKTRQEQLALDMERMKEQYLSSYVNRNQEEYQSSVHIAFYKMLCKMKYRLVEGTKECRRICITGEAGSGKSALMASMESRMKGEGDRTILYFCGNSGCQNIDTLKDFLIYRLEEILEQPHADNIVSKDDRLSFLSKQSAGKQIYCFIDGVDQLFENANEIYLDFLSLCPNLFYIISVLSDFPIRENVKDYPWGFYFIPMTNLSTEQRQELITMTAAKRGKQLNETIIEMTAAEPGAKNPLYLSMLLQRYFMMDKTEFEEAERIAPGMEGLHCYMRSLLQEMPDHPQSMARYLLKVTAERFGLEHFREILELLAISRYGLTEQELEAALRIANIRFLQMNFQRIVFYLYDAFSLREDGKWTFSHRLFQKAVLDEMTEADQENAIGMLIDYALADQDYLECEGFYYILESRHPAGIRALESAVAANNQQVFEYVELLIRKDRSYQIYFENLAEQSGTDAFGEFWLVFAGNRCKEKSEEVRIRILKKLMEKDDISDEIKCRCAVKIADDYFTQKKDFEDGYKYLYLAEQCCVILQEPRKSICLSEIYTNRALYRISGNRETEWKTAQQELEQAIDCLEPWIAKSGEEQAGIIRQDIHNKLKYAQLSGDYQKDYLADMLEECLQELNDHAGIFDKDILEKLEIDIRTMLIRAYLTRENFNSDKSIQHGKVALEMSKERARRDPVVSNIEMYMWVLIYYSKCFREDYRFLYLEECLTCVRRIYSSCPTEYWKNKLAYAECDYACAADYAVENNPAKFNRMQISKKANKSWRNGFRLFEELLEAKYPQVYQSEYARYLCKRAEFEKERGYLKEALSYARRGRELICQNNESIYEDNSQTVRGILRDANLVIAEVLDKTRKSEEALEFAQESVRWSYEFQKYADFMVLKTAKAWQILVRVLYHLRKDDEAMEKCIKAEEYYWQLREPDQQKMRAACAELHYIKSRIFLEKGMPEKASSCYELFWQYCEDKKNSWEYGQSLILKADILMRQEKREQAESVWTEAITLWNRRKSTERNCIKNWEEFQLYPANMKYARTLYPEGNYGYVQAAYYLLYSLYRKAVLTQNWDEIRGLNQYFKDSSGTSLDWTKNHMESKWIQYASPSFVRLVQRFPDELRDERKSEDEKAEFQQMCESVCETKCSDIDQFIQKMEEYTAKDNESEVVKALKVMEVNADNLVLWKPNLQQSCRIKDVLDNLYEYILDEKVQCNSIYKKQIEDLALKYHISNEYLDTIPLMSEKMKYLYGDGKTAAVHSWYPLLKLCRMILRCREPLSQKMTDEIKSLVVKIFYHSSWTEPDHTSFRGIVYVWDFSLPDMEELELILSSVDVESEIGNIYNIQYMKNMSVVELYSRTGNQSYIKKRLEELVRKDKFICDTTKSIDWKKNEQEKVSRGIWRIFRKLTQKEGAKWLIEYMDFINDNPELLQRLDYDSLQELNQEAEPFLKQEEKESGLLRERLEDFNQKKYEIGWKEWLL